MKNRRETRAWTLTTWLGAGLQMCWGFYLLRPSFWYFPSPACHTPHLLAICTSCQLWVHSTCLPAKVLRSLVRVKSYLKILWITIPAPCCHMNGYFTKFCQHAQLYKGLILLEILCHVFKVLIFNEFLLKENCFTVFSLFCQTSTWISHRYTYTPSLLKLPPISLPTPPL